MRHGSRRGCGRMPVHKRCQCMCLCGADARAMLCGAHARAYVARINVQMQHHVRACGCVAHEHEYERRMRERMQCECKCLCDVYDGACAPSMNVQRRRARCHCMLTKLNVNAKMLTVAKPARKFYQINELQNKELSDDCNANAFL
eukprot:6213303-Pleurochrysis_carterae.AAC.2